MGHGLSAYSDALDYLFVRTTGQWKFGLERTLALLDALGNPHEKLRIVHVGGTNGKGSVCATIERVLRDRGFRVGKYTSPHLVDFRERITLDGVPVTEQAVIEFIEEWTPTIERLGATFFEATTAMAFAVLARQEPDVVVVEVGLGGRLDATNVVDPMLAVVTNVGIDHTEYLGETRAEIAKEKAGIFKRDRHAIIGERDRATRELLGAYARSAHAAPIDIVHESAHVSDVRVSDAGTTFGIEDDSGTIECRSALLGAHQAENALIALRTLSVLPPPFRTPMRDAAASLGRVRLPGRFERSGKIIFDVAHNRDGAAVCAATMRAVAPPHSRVCVLSVLRDKDWRGMLEELAPVIDTFIITIAPTSPASRTWNAEDAHAAAVAMGAKALLIADFDMALRQAADEGQSVLITGSFHTVGDAMARLHVSPHGG